MNLIVKPETVLTAYPLLPCWSGARGLLLRFFFGVELTGVLELMGNGD